ncbi:MAG: ATP-binding protein [Steroidobacteraceae bacterium]
MPGDAGSSQRRAHPLPGAGYLLRAALFIVAYVLVDWLSYLQPVLQLGITPWNPQTGLALAFLVWQGPRGAVAVALAALLSEVIVRDVPAGSIAAIATSIWIAIAYTGLAAILRRKGPAALVATPGDAARFVGACLGATLFVGVGFIAIMLAMGALPEDVALGGVARYWVGDFNGVLTLTPLLLWAPSWRKGLGALRARWREALLQLAVLAFSMWMIFVVLSDQALRFFYPLFVPMIWLALRWGVVGAVVGALAIQVGLAFMVKDVGAAPPLFELQFLMLTLNLTALLLGATVSERQRAQAQLRERDEALARAMRFATAGEMASALTHELNQPITALVSYLRAAEILAAPGEARDARLPETLGKAASEAIRASAVLRRLRDFYSTGQAACAPLSLAALCDTVNAAFHERLRRAGVQLACNVGADLPPVAADPTQLEIVLHNLVANAIDAMAATEGAVKRIDITAERRHDHVRLAVADSGPGVAADVVARVFEPFVTSKPAGMGLGLAISRSLLRAQGGDLEYMEADGTSGARFVLSLPLAGDMPRD